MPKAIAITAIVGLGKETIAPGSEFEATADQITDLIKRGAAKSLPKPAAKAPVEPEKDMDTTEPEADAGTATKAAVKAGVRK